MKNLLRIQAPLIGAAIVAVSVGCLAYRSITPSQPTNPTDIGKPILNRIALAPTHAHFADSIPAPDALTSADLDNSPASTTLPEDADGTPHKTR